MNNENTIIERLRIIFDEIRAQPHLANHFGYDSLSFDEEMEQTREFLENTGEYGLVYESVVAMLEQVPFVLSGKASVALLEVGLLLGYKTDSPSDIEYDRRNIGPG